MNLTPPFSLRSGKNVVLLQDVVIHTILSLNCRNPRSLPPRRAHYYRPATSLHFSKRSENEIGVMEYKVSFANSPFWGSTQSTPSVHMVQRGHSFGWVPKSDAPTAECRQTLCRASSVPRTAECRQILYDLSSVLRTAERRQIHY